jgi:hypothetical protein
VTKHHSEIFGSLVKIGVDAGFLVAGSILTVIKEAIVHPSVITGDGS